MLRITIAHEIKSKIYLYEEGVQPFDALQLPTCNRTKAEGHGEASA